MRGSGSLRAIVGRPIYGKKRDNEPNLHEPEPTKKRKSKSAGAAPAPGQKSIIQFYSVAPPSARSQQAPPRAATPDDAAAAAEPPPHRSRSAPLPYQQQHAAAAGTRSPAAVAAAAGDGTSPRPSDLRSPSPDTSCAPFTRDGSGVFVIPTRLVGRQHQAAGWPPPFGAQLRLEREAHNPVDPCAILVCSVDEFSVRRTHGHLPAAVACHLAPLLDGGSVQVEVQLPSLVAAAAGGGGGGAAAAAAGGGGAAADLVASRQLGSPPPPAAGDEDRPTSSQGEQRQQQQQQQGQQQGQQHQLQLRVTLADSLTSSSQSAVAAGVAAALQRAASAGQESLQPARSSGATLSAAFEHILTETRRHDFHLLSQQEQDVLQHMQALPPPAKALLLRLLLRKRTWFQLSTLAYADVPQPSTAASRLSAVGLLQWDSDPHADLNSLLQELPVVPVLKQVLGAVLPKGHPAMVQMAAGGGVYGGGYGGGYGSSSSSGPNKAAIISSIQANASRARLQAAIAAAAGPCVAVTRAATDTFARLQLLYFASPGQDLSMFVAVERGAVCYPSYTMQRTRPMFSDRQQVLAYEAALTLAAQVDTALEEGDNAGAWQLLQPALSELQAGVHKRIVWDEACAPVPNPPPATSQQPAPAPQAAAAAAGDAGADSLVPPCTLDVPPQSPASGNNTATAALQNVPLQSSPSTAVQHQQPSAAAAAADVDMFSAAAVAAGPRQRSMTPAHQRSAVSDCTADCSSSDDVSWDTADTAGAAGEQPSAPASVQATAGLRQQQQSAVPQAAPEPPEPVQSAHANTAAAAAGEAPPAATQQAAPPSSALVAVAGGGGTSAAAGPPPLFFARFCAGWVYASMGTVAASLLERQKKWDEAIDVLRLLLGGNACVGRRGDWWTRLAINLEHLGRTEDALEAVEAALADAWVRGGDLLGLQRRYLRLGKPPRRWKRPPWSQAAAWEPPEVVITARPLNNTTGLKSRFYAPDNSLVTVEQLALQHYASEEAGGWQGLHCEGGVFATLFTLLLWDVMFMGVPDVFRSPFQTCPLDLDTDAFYPARRQQLDTQLTRIADSQAGAILKAVWAANAGVMVRGVNWQRFTQQQLLEICDCVGGLGLAAVLRLMAEDHAGAAGGLPDLLLWRPSDCSAKLVEVKGPRDRLSHQQRFWLAHMANNTMQVEVLKVKEPQQGSKRK